MDWQDQRSEPPADSPVQPSARTSSSFKRIGRRFSGRLHRLDTYHWMLVGSVVVLAVVGILYWRSRGEETEEAVPNPADELLPIVDEYDIDGPGGFLLPPESRPEPRQAASGAEPAAGISPAASTPAAEETSRVEEERPGPAPVERPEPAGETLSHTVKKGETLWSIAVYYYGTGNAWRKIADANPDINPDLLTPGQRLRIPPR